jgi:hypothetical protein
MGKQMSSDKDVRDIIKIAIKSGWKVEKSGSKHIMLFPPDKDKGFVTLSNSPRSTRNFKNTVMMLRAKGLNV